jgi:hypothetical protein
VAASAAGFIAVLIVVYVSIIRSQSGRPAVWFLVVLCAAMIAAGYGAHRGSPRRRAALTIAGVALVGTGVLAILSIGYLLLIAGTLCLVAAARSRGVAELRAEPGHRPA